MPENGVPVVRLVGGEHPVAVVVGEARVGGLELTLGVGEVLGGISVFSFIVRVVVFLLCNAFIACVSVIVCVKKCASERESV